MKRAMVALLESFVIAIFLGSLTGVLYAFVIPYLFPGFGTKWIFVFGVLVATAASGIVGYRSVSTDRPVVRVLAGCCHSVLAAGIASYIALFITLNFRGE